MILKQAGADVKLLGVVSFGSEKGCASATNPGVYTRMSRYNSWAKNIMEGVAPLQTHIRLGSVGEAISIDTAVSIINNGTTDKMIQSTILSGDTAFSIKKDNCLQTVLQAGKTCQVILTLNGKSTGRKQAQLRFNLGTRNIHTNLTAEVLPEVNLGTALDTKKSMKWFSGGDAQWSVETDTHATGGSVARTGVLLHNQYSVLSTVVEGPGKLDFLWKSSTEENYDDLRFLINGETISRISGEQAFTASQHTLKKGQHILTWVYSRDREGDGGENTGYLDKVAYKANNKTVNNPAVHNRSGSSGGSGSLTFYNLLLGIVLLVMKLSKKD